MSRAQPSRKIVVYDGSRLLGTIRETPDRRRWIATGAHDQSLGEYPVAREAADAITAEHDRESAERLRKVRTA